MEDDTSSVVQKLSKDVIDDKVKQVTETMTNMSNYAYLIRLTDTLKPVQIFDDEDRKHILQEMKTLKKQITVEGERLKKVHGNVYHMYIHMKAITEVRQNILENALIRKV